MILTINYHRYHSGMRTVGDRTEERRYGGKKESAGRAKVVAGKTTNSTPSTIDMDRRP